MSKRRAGTITVELLEQWGIEHIYGLPGDSINELVEDLRRKENQLRFIQVRHEEVGALAAAAEAKLTGKIGVCLSIAGPGAVHLLNGLYDAKMDGAPLLVFAGQVASNEVGRGAFQEIDLTKIFDDVAVFNEQVYTAESLPDLVNQAIRSAYSHNGVAVLSVPDDLFSEKITYKTPYTSPTFVKPSIHPDKQAILNATELINQSKRPIILAGKGTKDASFELEQFAEKAGTPIILTLPAKGVLPDEHPYLLGHLGQIGTKPAYEAMFMSDLIIMIGTSYPYREYLPNDVKAIQIDTNPEKIGKRYPVDVGMVSPANRALSALTTSIDYKSNRSFINECATYMKRWREEIKQEQQRKASPLKPQQAISVLQNHIEPNAVLSVDVGTVTVWMARYFRMTQQDFIVSSWLATMGCGLPGAIAAKLTYPDRQVVAVVGDGGFSMVMQDFVTAVKYKLPIIVVILNNQHLGLITFEQEVKGNIDYETELETINFAQFAESCGGVGISVTDPDKLDSAIRQATVSNQPAIIDVMIQNEPPIPGKILPEQAVNYSKAIMKKFVNGHPPDNYPIRKGVKRLF